MPLKQLLKTVEGHVKHAVREEAQHAQELTARLKDQATKAGEQAIQKGERICVTAKCRTERHMAQQLFQAVNAQQNELKQIADQVQAQWEQVQQSRHVISSTSNMNHFVFVCEAQLSALRTLWPQGE